MEISSLPPVCIEAEESILGALLFDPNAIYQVVNLIPDSEPFYINSHKIIYRAILALNKKGKPNDFLHVSQYLQAHSQLEDVGGTTKLANLLNSTVSAVVLQRVGIKVQNQDKPLINLNFRQ